MNSNISVAVIAHEPERTIPALKMRAKEEQTVCLTVNTVLRSIPNSLLFSTQWKRKHSSVRWRKMEKI